MRRATARFRRNGGWLGRAWRFVTIAFAASLVGPAAVMGAGSTDLALTFTHFPDPGMGLEQVIFTVHVANAGPAAATLRVVNTLPPGASFDSAGGIGWDCVGPVASVVTCTLPGLAAGASSSLLGIAVIAPLQGGTLIDTATVSAAESDPVPANSTATDSVVVNPAPPRTFYPVAPCRLVDTRDPAGPRGGPALAANSTRGFYHNLECNLPPEARALAVNVTVVDASDAGDLRVYPQGTSVPGASTINFAPGQVRANSAIVSLYQGAISVRCDMPGTTGTVHFILDVSGYFR